MKRLIARIWINWVLDDDRDLPGRLARWIAADPQLADYFESQCSMIQQLRASAENWTVNSSAESCTFNPSPPQKAFGIGTSRVPASFHWRIGLSVCLLLLTVSVVVGLNWSRWNNYSPTSSSQVLPATPLGTPQSDPKQVLSQIASESWTALQESQQKAKTRVNSLVQSIDQDVLLEGHRLAVDIQQMKSYFTDLLPNRTAAIIGLK